MATVDTFQVNCPASLVTYYPHYFDAYIHTINMSLVCTEGGQMVTRYANTPTLGVGVVLYNDPNLTDPAVNGSFLIGTTYYGISESGPSYNGVIDYTGTCS